MQIKENEKKAEIKEQENEKKQEYEKEIKE